MSKEKSTHLILIFVFIFFLGINSVYFFINLNTSFSDNIYAFNELFINYQAGFIRRGLLGEVAWQLNNFYSIDPKTFFSLFFFLIYLFQIILFFFIVQRYLVSKLIFFTIIFSPSILLFHIYSPELFFLKDGLVKFTFLFHCFIFYKYFFLKKDKESYLKFLKFLIIPILFVVILVHEYQVFALSLHFLISLGSVQEKKGFKKLLKFYYPLIIPIFLIIIFFGNQVQFENLSEILKKFNIELNPYLGGGLYHYIGGFYKWHFFYFSYRDFINLFFSFILSILIFYVLFDYLIQNKVVSFFSKYQFNYQFYFVPVLIPFLLTSDHGRNISFVSFYLISFFIILKLDRIKLLNNLNTILKNCFSKYSIFIFIFFYIFMWKLDQVAGFGLQGKANDIFQSSLFAEVIKLIKFLYNYVDLNIINLPEIKL